MQPCHGSGKRRWTLSMGLNEVNKIFLCIDIIPERQSVDSAVGLVDLVTGLLIDVGGAPGDVLKDRVSKPGS